MLEITRIPCGSGNCFCVENEGNAILIDTCRIEHRDKILAECRDKNIRLIVLSHGHVDHIQNAAALSRELNAPIAMHRADYELIADNMSEPMFAHTLVGKYVLATTVKSLERDMIEPFEPVVFLEDGDTLDDFGIEAVIIGLPGHTKGSIGILLDKSDLFVGDALMNLVYPAKSHIYGNKEDMKKSAEKISTFKNATIHFGHGKSIENKVR